MAPVVARGVADVAELAAAPRVRRTQAERSRLTRDKLIRATVELIRIRGYGGLTTAEVSARAGVSRGAQLHHFPTKNDLILETLRVLNEDMLRGSFERAAQAQASAADPLDALVDDAFAFFFSDYFRLSLAIGMSDERNDTLLRGMTPVVGPSRLRVERRWIEVLTARGWPGALAEDVAALGLAIVRGFTVRRLIEDDRARFEALMREWKRMATDLLRRAAAPARAKPAR